MQVKITHHSYGKTLVRLTKVRRLSDRNELVEMGVNISLEGDFARSYTHGDNSMIVATDSMRNTVYVLAKAHPVDSPESFASHLARHFVVTYPQVQQATVRIEQSAWRRIDVGGKAHPNSFESAGEDRRTAHVSVTRGPKSSFEVMGGLKNLMLLKTTDSAFTGFVRDKYTTLSDSADRILATSLTARWQFSPEAALKGVEAEDAAHGDNSGHGRSGGVDFNVVYDRLRRVMLEVFAAHKSDAVQQTLYAMGEAALAAEPRLSCVAMEMPNKHRVPFNFTPLGLAFENDVYVTTDEPSGNITAVIERG